MCWGRGVGDGGGEDEQGEEEVQEQRCEEEFVVIKTDRRR